MLYQYLYSSQANFESLHLSDFSIALLFYWVLKFGFFEAHHYVRVFAVNFKPKTINIWFFRFIVILFYKTADQQMLQSKYLSKPHNRHQRFSHGTLDATEIFSAVSKKYLKFY